MATDNPGWGYDRIVGALANLGHKLSDQTVGNILRRHGIPPAPKRITSTTWKDFLASHMAVLAGVDFFTVEVLTWRDLATYYVLFFLHLETRRVTLAGITRHPTEEWMKQIARNGVDADSGYLRQVRYVLHDRDSKFCASFKDILKTAGVTSVALPPRSPNLNAFAERWVRSVKQECLSKLILFGEASLRRALAEFETHYHHERNPQGKGNVLLFPAPRKTRVGKTVKCTQRIGMNILTIRQSSIVPGITTERRANGAPILVPWRLDRCFGDGPSYSLGARETPFAPARSFIARWIASQANSSAGISLREGAYRLNSRTCSGSGCRFSWIALSTPSAAFIPSMPSTIW